MTRDACAVSEEAGIFPADALLDWFAACKSISAPFAERTERSDEQLRKAFEEL
jgi:hypothetical protein